MTGRAWVHQSSAKIASGIGLLATSARGKLAESTPASAGVGAAATCGSLGPAAPCACNARASALGSGTSEVVGAGARAGGSASGAVVAGATVEPASGPSTAGGAGSEEGGAGSAEGATAPSGAGFGLGVPLDEAGASAVGAWSPGAGVLGIGSAGEPDGGVEDAPAEGCAAAETERVKTPAKARVAVLAVCIRSSSVSRGCALFEKLARGCRTRIEKLSTHQSFQPGTLPGFRRRLGQQR